MQHLEKFLSVLENKHIPSQIEVHSLLIFFKTLNTFSRSYFPGEKQGQLLHSETVVD